MPSPKSGRTALVIGAGHNGLVAANYLADAGLTVTVLERRDVVGGATVTEELIPGFKSSSCSYVSGLLHPRVTRDLQLGRHGLRLYQSDMGSANLLRDGRTLFLFNELGATLRSLEKVMPGESQRFVAFGLRLERLNQLLSPYLLSTPPSLSEVVAAFDTAGESLLFDEFFTLSAKDLLDRYLESDILKGLLCFIAMVSVFGGPRTPGWSYVYGHHAIGEYDGKMGQFALPKGGMGAIAGALAARAVSRGVSIRTGAGVRTIGVEAGTVTGVETVHGDFVEADLVLSNADPQRTFLELVAADELPADFRQRLARLDMRGSMARVHMALDGLPDFVGCPPGEGPQHRGLTVLGADMEAFERVADAQRYGHIANDFPVEFVIQSVTDDSLAPTGKHMLMTGIQQLPYALAGGSTWDAVRESFTEQVIEVVSGYAPRLRDHLIATHTITPLDLERDYGLTGGNIFQGAMTLGQLFDRRPIAGYNSYGSPIRGLYLCGAGTHPGGGVMGLPGRNAALFALDVLHGHSTSPATAKRASAKAPVVHRLMSHPRVQRAGVALARRPLVAPLVERMSRRRSQ